MAMIVHKDIKQDYLDALSKTLKEIEEQKEKIFEDMFEKQISGINISINIEPGNIVNYSINKTYCTKGE